MNDTIEIPLRPRKNFVRRLRTASNRLFRNNFLSSIRTNDPEDIE